MCPWFIGSCVRLCPRDRAGPLAVGFAQCLCLASQWGPAPINMMLTPNECWFDLCPPGNPQEMLVWPSVYVTWTVDVLVLQDARPFFVLW
jgi:hypothetical protein